MFLAGQSHVGIISVSTRPRTYNSKSKGRLGYARSAIIQRLLIRLLSMSRFTSLFPNGNSLIQRRYVKEILAKTYKSVDQVTIEPDGKWSTNFKPASPSNGGNNAYGSDGDDDIIEIKDSSSLATRTQSTPITTASTPQAFLSREASAALAPPRSVSHKRPISAVIDLTLSDDDDEPVRPPKRQSIAGFGIPTAPPVYTGADQNGQGSQNGQDHLNGYSNGYP
jgi:hypothetical protein